MNRSRLLFFFLLACFVAVSTGRVHVQDEVAVLLQARGLVETGALVVAELAAGPAFYGLHDRDGRLRAPNGPAHALAVAPFYLLGAVLASVPGMPQTAVPLVGAFGAVLSSAVFAALAATLLGVLLERLGVSPRAALAASLALAFASPLFSYSAYLFPEPLVTALLLGAALALFDRAGPVSTSRAALAGLLLGAAFLARPSQAIAFPLFLAALVAREPWCGWRRLAALAGGFAPAVVVYLGWNFHLYGDPLEFGYPATADGGKALNGFETPILRGLFGLAASPGKSVLLFAPALLPALAGLPRLFRRDRGLGFLAVALPVGYLLFYARYTQWEGGYCFGPRYLLPAIPLLFVALGLLLDTPGRGRLVVPFVAAGALVQALGLATSFLEAQQRGGYYDQEFTYRMDHSALSAHGALLVRYVTAAVTGDPALPFGAGFDRWFVLLGHAGVAWPLLLAVAASALAVALWSGLSLAGAGRGRMIWFGSAPDESRVR